MTRDTSKFRLDQLMVERGLAPSRSRASDMISRGAVQVDGRTARKAGMTVGQNSKIFINDPATGYVSRAALKLIGGLDVSGFNVIGKDAVDIGASTGGFTQVLLERGAGSVVAIDVGHGQMNPEISSNPRVTNIEGLNARDLTLAALSVQPNFIVSDVSFISIKLAVEPALTICAEDSQCILLVKPQFEVGPDGVGKGGLVKNQDLIDETCRDIQKWFTGLSGWSINNFIPSPIKGGDGNREFLLCGTRNV